VPSYSEVFSRFAIWLTGYFPWVVNDSGKMVMSWTVSDGMELANMGDFSELLTNNQPSLTHLIQVDHSNKKTLSVFHPLFESNHQLFLVFSYPIENLTRTALKNSLAYGIISLIIILIILFYFTNSVRNSSLEKERVRQSEMALTKVLHYLPTGIVLMDKNQRVRQVNRAAVKLFHLEDEDIVLGQMLNEEMLFSNSGSRKNLWCRHTAYAT
jgi:PAS domain-containing protein